MQIEKLKEYIQEGKFELTLHSTARLLSRGITEEDIINCIHTGEVIEDYPNDYPYPSCLVCGVTVDGKIIHIVVGIGEDLLYIITAYFPNIEKFETDFKTRRGM